MIGQSPLKIDVDRNAIVSSFQNSMQKCNQKGDKSLQFVGQQNNVDKKSPTDSPLPFSKGVMSRGGSKRASTEQPNTELEELRKGYKEMEGKYQKLLESSLTQKMKLKRNLKKDKRKTVLMKKILDIAQNNPIALGGFLTSLGSKLDL